MTDRDYKIPGGGSVRFNTGQPLGAYSSWAAFTLCHHFVVWLAGHRCAKAVDDLVYLILGDDIVIRGDDVAQAYKEIMQSLGVDISEAKTHVSEDTFEFAKRWFHKGVEISPFPVHGIVETKGSYDLLATTVSQAEGKG